MHASDYRQVRRLLAAPSTATLATADDGRYLLARAAVLRVSGPGMIPGWAGAFAGLDDGVYTLTAAGPRRSPAGEPSVRAVRSLLGKLQSTVEWQPVSATRWALVTGPRGRTAQVLARRDTDGVSRPTALSAALWERWHAALQDPGSGQTLHAWQPDRRPAHALKMSVSAAGGETWTAGYIMPVALRGAQLRDASGLVRAPAGGSADS